MTDTNADETAFLATLDNLVEGLDDMLDELSRLIYTLSRKGQRTDKPLALYRALVESANQAKTLRSQEIEALQIGGSESQARLGGEGLNASS
nr:hypothetical protein [uncultured Noviherbaspirillum sp.]